MFKVLIADDEIYVVALIQKLINWEKFQMKVEATANDGATALQLVKEIKPDVVIVDIRMPGYDGISFMDKVREFNTNVKFIVISGHKQFDYAKGAMRNNAEDYLLKPINKEELEHVLAHVFEQLLETREKETKVKNMEEELDVSKNRVRESLVEAVLFQRELPENVSEINAKFYTRFEQGEYDILSLVVDTPSFFREMGENDLLVKEMQKNLLTALKTVCIDVISMEYRNMTVYFLNVSAEKREKLPSVLQKEMQKYTKLVKKFENILLYICMGEVCEDVMKMQESVKHLWQCILGRTAFGSGRVISYAEIKKNADLFPAIWEFRKEKFYMALEDLNMNELNLCIREMYSKAFYGIEEDTMLYYSLYTCLVREIWKYFHNIGILCENQNVFEERFYEKYLTAGSYSEYVKILCSEIQKIIEENHLADKNQVTPAIRIVKSYIAEHYQEEISLGMAAKKVNLSPVYLSRLFKKEEGINFLDYLNQYRIDMAKRFLTDVKYNIIEVAELVGFKNTRYFSKIFKKQVGITPSEYRKRHMKER
ncbi:MAG TPA: response regulator [Candidatus Blautia faecipullorum]|nr:response regulator [Candidatus Blautia faecipullorum]